MPVVPVPKSLLAALKLAASCICILTLLTVASSSLFKRQNASPLPKKHGLFLPQSQNAAPTDKGQNKFFHESTFDNHYDGRFTMAPVSYEQRKLDLHNLAVSYLHTMREIGVETWLMHGTLLGWWWSRKNMPWDFDADVQMTAESLEFVAGHYNMSVWDFEIDENKWGLDVDGLKEEEEDGEKQDFRKADELKEEGNVQEEDGEEQDVGKADEENTGMDGRNVKSYLLEINPNYWRRDRGVISKANVIDGRWIDTTSGLYIDITILWKDENHPAGSGMLVSKDGHEFKENYIFPLKETVFEGVSALIPAGYKEVLAKEYGNNALTNAYFKGHHFDEKAQEWIPLPPLLTRLAAAARRALSFLFGGAEEQEENTTSTKADK